MVLHAQTASRPLRRVTESVFDIATTMHPNLFENHQ
jgi:hypothetical protein